MMDTIKHDYQIMTKEQETGNTPKRERLPNKAFDREYMTEWYREVRYLKDHGIMPTYLKLTPTYHIRQYKYEKTPELFEALVQFYSQVRNEKEFIQANKAIDESLTSPDWAIANGGN